MTTKKREPEKFGVDPSDQYNAPSGPKDYRHHQLTDEARRATPPEGIRKVIDADDAKRKAERDALVDEIFKRVMSGK